MFGRPIHEARPKPMNRVAGSKLVEPVQHLTFMTGEKLALAAGGESKHVFCERHAMLFPLFHAFGGHNPRLAFDCVQTHSVI